MSVEQVKQFYDEISEDEDLQAEFEDLDSEEAVVEKAMALGSDHGYDFSAEDVKTALEQAREQTNELNEAELENVAGGTAAHGCGGTENKGA